MPFGLFPRDSPCPHQKEDHNMINTTNPLAARLHCSLMPIPVEYKDRASALTSKYVRNNSLSGEYRMDSGIVYNRICHMINRQITDNPAFNVKRFPRRTSRPLLFPTKRTRMLFFLMCPASLEESSAVSKGTKLHTSMDWTNRMWTRS